MKSDESIPWIESIRLSVLDDGLDKTAKVLGMKADDVLQVLLGANVPKLQAQAEVAVVALRK